MCLHLKAVFKYNKAVTTNSNNKTSLTLVHLYITYGNQVPDNLGHLGSQESSFKLK
jgi:hypothetical protein